MSRIVLFQVIFFSILIFLILFEYIIFSRWMKRISHQKLKNIFSILYWSIVVISNVGLLVLFIIRKNIYLEIDGFLKPIYYFILSWNYAFFFGILIWSISFVILWFIYYFIKKIQNLKNSTEKKEYEISRKAFLTSSVGLILDTTPFLGAGVNFSGMFLGSKDFIINERNIKIPNLERSFVGFSILQISDLHIGSLINERYLKPSLEIIDHLKPDIIVVTGDILDNSNLYLSIVGGYFRKLNEIAPVYAILGNHDHIDKPELLVETLRLANINILVNDYAIIKRGKHAINLIGLDYPIKHFESKLSRADMTKFFFNDVYKKIHDKEKPTIVLNHHPSEFEFFKYQPIQLVLAGHTHGGQIILSDNRESSLSVASNFLKYYVDLYTENNVSLYVNRGLGHWFPLRINCPPEITLIHLI